MPLILSYLITFTRQFLKSWKYINLILSKPRWESWPVRTISDAACLNMYISWIISLLIHYHSIILTIIIETRSWGLWGDLKHIMVRSLIGLPRCAEKCLLLYCNSTQSIQINAIPSYPFSQGLSSTFVDVEVLPSKDAELSQIICNFQHKCRRLSWLNGLEASCVKLVRTSNKARHWEKKPNKTGWL